MPKKTPAATSPAEDVVNDHDIDQATVAKKSAVMNDAPGPRQKATVVKSATAASTPAPRPWYRRWWVWTIAGVVVLGGAAAAGFYFLYPSTSTTTVTNTTTNTNATALVPRVLDGVPVPPDQANPQIIAVMVENSWESRPASGLDKASVVYSALAEGGITRFMALFPSTTHVDEIGPIRSSRQYYIDYAEEYHALYTHVGGSPQAMAYLRSGKANVYNFDQFAYSPMFWRDHTRAAPHNLYSKSDFLNIGFQKYKVTGNPSYTSWAFTGETPIDSRGMQTNPIVINYSSFNYKVSYTYDRGLNQYQRFQGDKPMVMRDGTSIEAKNVVVMYVQAGLLTGDKERLAMTTTGTGQILMFRDGQVLQGTWKKDSVTSRTQFLDAQGQALALNPGQTWIEVVPTDRKVTY